MSRLARALVLAATLAAMTLVGLTAAAQAHPASDDAARRQALAQERYYESFDGGTTPRRPRWPGSATTAPGDPARSPRPRRSPAGPNRGVVVLGAVAAALALVALTAMTAPRARRRLRARQAA